MEAKEKNEPYWKYIFLNDGCKIHGNNAIEKMIYNRPMGI
jgi:hypothetical protein